MILVFFSIIDNLEYDDRQFLEGRQPKNKTLPLDGIKSSIIDEMFFHNAENIDGGAIQYITPFKVKKLIELQMLEEIK